LTEQRLPSVGCLAPTQLVNKFPFLVQFVFHPTVTPPGSNMIQTTFILHSILHLLKFSCLCTMGCLVKIWYRFAFIFVFMRASCRANHMIRNL